ncbi:hypothetical protein [Methylorubrum populi]
MTAGQGGFSTYAREGLLADEVPETLCERVNGIVGRQQHDTSYEAGKQARRTGRDVRFGEECEGQAGTRSVRRPSLKMNWPGNRTAGALFRDVWGYPEG